MGSDNIVIENLEQEKNCKEKLVVMSNRWYSNGTLLDEIPRTSFEVAHGWKKSPLLEFELVLIQELIFISNLQVYNRHWRVLLSRTALAKCEYLAGYSPQTLGFKDLNALKPNNLIDAMRDLVVDNKRNRLILESLSKSTCHVTEVAPREGIIKKMPSPKD